MQRQASERSTSTVGPETVAKEMAEQSQTVASRDLPLVQRQPVEQMPTPTVPQQSAVADQAVASAQPQAVPSQPVVQRQASEPSTSTIRPERVAKEMAEQSQTVASRDLPLVQRQADGAARQQPPRLNHQPSLIRPLHQHNLKLCRVNRCSVRPVSVRLQRLGLKQ